MADSNRGQFVWYENLTKDPKGAIAFYTEVVGWKTQPFGAGSDYEMWVGSQGPLGGVYTLPAEAENMGAPPHWIGNVLVDDVDATAAQVVTLGGKIYKAPADIPTVGRFAVIADPQGAPIAIFNSSQGMAPHDASKEGEFCWHELLTSDSAAAFAFYSAIFGWKVLQEMDMGPMGTYRIYGICDKALGGMMTISCNAGMKPHWLYYVAVSDLDAALARATKRGATVLNGPMDVPDGRIVQLKDPQGAAFALHQAAKK